MIAIIIATAVVVVLVCTLIFIAYVITKCITYKLQSPAKKVCNGLLSAGKTIDKYDDEVFSKKNSQEHANKGSDIVKEIAGDCQSHRDPGSRSGPPPKKHQRHQIYSSPESGQQSGQQIRQLPASSLAIASFVADKMYIGLKHPGQHGKTFRDIVQRVMDETKPVNTEGESQITTSFNGLNTQQNEQVDINFDENKSAN